MKSERERRAYVTIAVHACCTMHKRVFGSQAPGGQRLVSEERAQPRFKSSRGPLKSRAKPEKERGRALDKGVAR